MARWRRRLLLAAVVVAIAAWRDRMLTQHERAANGRINGQANGRINGRVNEST